MVHKCGKKNERNAMKELFWQCVKVIFGRIDFVIKLYGLKMAFDSQNRTLPERKGGYNEKKHRSKAISSIKWPSCVCTNSFCPQILLSCGVLQPNVFQRVMADKSLLNTYHVCFGFASPLSRGYQICVKILNQKYF